MFKLKNTLCRFWNICAYWAPIVATALPPIIWFFSSFYDVLFQRYSKCVKNSDFDMRNTVSYELLYHPNPAHLHIYRLLYVVFLSSLPNLYLNGAICLWVRFIFAKGKKLHWTYFNPTWKSSIFIRMCRNQYFIYKGRLFSESAWFIKRYH